MPAFVSGLGNQERHTWAQAEIHSAPVDASKKEKRGHLHEHPDDRPRGTRAPCSRRPQEPPDGALEVKLHGDLADIVAFSADRGANKNGVTSRGERHYCRWLRGQETTDSFWFP
jgi:hypothetical protein